MKRILSYFTIKMPWTLVYMQQQVEYSPSKFLKWTAAVPNLFQVQNRGELDLTSRAKLMLGLSYLTAVMTFMTVSFWALWLTAYWLFLALLLLPQLCVVVIFVTTLLLQSIIVNPKQNREIRAAKQKLSAHTTIRIAVLGSYGKTTMKELLVTVLSEAKSVAATPGNKNVLISHARWVNRKLTGKEDVLVFEYGEAQPGDIATLANFSQPTIAVVTGLAPAHLDAYPNLEAVADDFATIQNVVTPDNTFVSGNDELLRAKIKGSYYDSHGIDSWKVSGEQVDFSGTRFTLTSGNQKLNLQTGLLGKHQIGPLSAVVAIAMKLGLTDKQIVAGVAATRPYEHRMQPRHLGGAWIIDDTYNGTIEGMRAGLELLKTLPGKRKVYVTPGLVDQGTETEITHQELGTLIAAAQPDQVVLMQNSVTEHIRTGLEQAGFRGELKLETKPLEYYTNLEHFLAAGDVVMLQNDWPDSYK